TWRGLAEARSEAESRGLPSVATLSALAVQLDRELAPEEVVMSNLGSTLAWFARRPVVHLALTPADVAACRQQVPFRRIVLAFRDPARAWAGWAPVVARPEVVREHPEWRMTNARTWLTHDGFRVVSLELSER